MRNIYGIETDPAVIQLEKWKTEIEAERLEVERRETERAEAEQLELARLAESDSTDAELEAGEYESEEWPEESEPEVTEEQQRANRERLESVFKSYACTGLSFPAVRLTPVPRRDVKDTEPERIHAIVADVLSGCSSSTVRL